MSLQDRAQAVVERLPSWAYVLGGIVVFLLGIPLVAFGIWIMGSLPSGSSYADWVQGIAILIVALFAIVSGILAFLGGIVLVVSGAAEIWEGGS